MNKYFFSKLSKFLFYDYFKIFFILHLKRKYKTLLEWFLKRKFKNE
jgi:hypothetical protein